jgi:hypothetical protein
MMELKNSPLIGYNYWVGISIIVREKNGESIIIWRRLAD